MIYFFIPAYNEQDTAGVLLFRLRQVMQSVRQQYQVLIALDGCTDNTPEVVAPYLQLMPLRVIAVEGRLGYARALWKAVREVASRSENPKRDFFLVLDADFTQDPGKILEMAEHIERNVDLYSGTRFAAGPKAPRLHLKKRLAQAVVPLILRLKGIDWIKKADFLTTFRGCRVQLLRRNFKSLSLLSELGPDQQPSVAALLFLLILHRDSRKYLEFPFQEKMIRRRPSRFRLFRLVRFLLLSRILNRLRRELPEQSEPQPKTQSQPRRRSRRRPSNKKSPAPSKSGQQNKTATGKTTAVPRNRNTSTGKFDRSRSRER